MDRAIETEMEKLTHYFLSLPLDQRSPRFPEMFSAVSTPNTITISWSLNQTNSRNEVFTVMYGTSPGDLNITSGQVFSMPGVQQYSTVLVSLLPATLYHYQVRSTNSLDSVTDEERSIRTMDDSEFMISFTGAIL